MLITVVVLGVIVTIAYFTGSPMFGGFDMVR